MLVALRLSNGMTQIVFRIPIVRHISFRRS
jgi:hypothetical protein